MSEISAFGGSLTDTRTLRVGAGLFVLRYVGSSAGSQAPAVAISAPPGSNVDILSEKGANAAWLAKVGDAVVVRSDRESSILATIEPLRRGGSRDAEFVFERLHNGLRQPQVNGLASDERLGSHSFRADDITILAHVARRGDLIIPAGDWVCGPQLPMAIEGFELRWRNRPAGVDLLAGATIKARELKTVSPLASGHFVGSRGKAAPLSGLTIALTGPDAGSYVLRCDAVFLGSSVISKSGRTIELSGPTGMEPLVGLRLFVVATSDNNETTAGRSQIPASRPAPRVESIRPAMASSNDTGGFGSAGRVRVFRTSRARATV